MTVDLSADATAPRQARRAAREALGRWQLPALVDRVLVVVSELVTNGVRYGRPPLRLVLRRTERSVRVDVHDAVPSPPRLAAGIAEDDRESGRGLLIVRALADDVGVEPVPDGGKRVFASFST